MIRNIRSVVQYFVSWKFFIFSLPRQQTCLAWNSIYIRIYSIFLHKWARCPYLNLQYSDGMERECHSDDLYFLAFQWWINFQDQCMHLVLFQALVSTQVKVSNENVQHMKLEKLEKNRQSSFSFTKPMHEVPWFYLPHRIMAPWWGTFLSWDLFNDPPQGSSNYPIGHSCFIPPTLPMFVLLSLTQDVFIITTDFNSHCHGHGLKADLQWLLMHGYMPRWDSKCPRKPQSIEG